jgi:polyvinyl alcohol dehydrogenase (cytochrome)
MQGDIRRAIGALVGAGALILTIAAPASAAEQQAQAEAFTFVPPVVSITQGDTLRFANTDVAPHTLTSDTANQFDSANVPAGASALVAGVDKLAPGRYTFHCDLHPWMHGVLQVSAPGSSSPVDLPPKAAPAPLTGGDWPFYGKDLANSRDGGASGPSASEVPFLAPVWTVAAADGDFVGTPVVSGGTLVDVSGGGTVYAVDASTGKVLWTRDVATAQGEVADATAAIADGRVFVPVAQTGDGGAKGPEIQALSLSDGTPLWRTVYDNQVGATDFGSPVVWDGKVIIGASGQNGDPDVPFRGSVTALDENTGQRDWQALLVPPGHNGAPVWSTPAVDTATGTVYVGTGNAYSGTAADTTDAIVALDGQTGAILRHYQATANDVFTASGAGATTGPDYDLGASPQLITGANGHKLVGEGQKSGIYWAFDRATLQPAWSFQTGAGSALGGVLGSTAYDGTRIYGPDTPGGEMWALGLDGTPAWLSTDGGPLHWAPVSVANGVVYSTDQNSLLTARDASTGAVLAAVPLGAPSYGGVAIAGGYVFASVGTQSSSGTIVGLRAVRPAARARAARRSARAARPG